MGKCQQKLYIVLTSDIHKYLIQPCYILASVSGHGQKCHNAFLQPQRAVENAKIYRDIHKNVPGIIEDFKSDLL